MTVLMTAFITSLAINMEKRWTFIALIIIFVLLKGNLDLDFEVGTWIGVLGLRKLRKGWAHIKEYSISFSRIHQFKLPIMLTLGFNLLLRKAKSVFK